MKIDNTRQTSGTSGTRKSSKTNGTSGGFEEYIEAGSTSEASAASAPQSIARVDALLAVQAVEDPTAKASKKRMIMRADYVLEELDKLRMAMLNNQISMDHMMNLADMVSAHKEKIQDVDLVMILDEIDLRAQVELAKMRKSLDKL